MGVTLYQLAMSMGKMVQACLLLFQLRVYASVWVLLPNAFLSVYSIAKQGQKHAGGERTGEFAADSMKAQQYLTAPSTDISIRQLVN